MWARGNFDFLASDGDDPCVCACGIPTNADLCCCAKDADASRRSSCPMIDGFFPTTE